VKKELKLLDKKIRWDCTRSDTRDFIDKMRVHLKRFLGLFLQRLL